MIKTHNQLAIEVRKLPHHKEVNIEKYTAITTLNGRRLKAYLQRSGAKQRSMLSPLLFNRELKFYTETFSRKINLKHSN